MWKINILLFVCFIFVTNTKAQEPQFVDVDEFYILFYENPAALIIDVRVWKDYKKERIEGALTGETSTQLYEIVEGFAKDQVILFYGNNEERARMAAQVLYKKDFTKVYVLYASYADLKQKEFPIDKSKRKK